MKVAIIGSRGYPYVYSGYETFVSEVAPRLNEAGVEVHVYCHKNLFGSKPKVVNNIFLHYIPSIPSKSLSQLSNSLLGTLHAIFCRYDVILYVNSANGLFGIITTIAGVKTAINVDGLEWLRPKWKGLGSKVFYFTSKMATRWMDVIVTDAEAMRVVYLEEFQTNSAVIAYGANVKESKNKGAIDKWNLIQNEYYLIVGRLIPDNNADLIIHGFTQSNSTKKLVVVGDVPYNDAYAVNIKNVKDERVIFTGYITDAVELTTLYHNSFAYFHGHEFGGTNPTLLKALAYGCCIIAIDTVFSREVLLGEEYGLLFAKDSSSIVRMIAYIEQNTEVVNIFKSKSRERVLKNYTWEKIANQYYTLFELISSQKTGELKKIKTSKFPVNLI